MQGLLFLIFGIPLLIAYVALWLAALVDVVRRDFREPNLKIVWVLVILFTHGFGAVIYFIVGRKQGTIGSTRIAG